MYSSRGLAYYRKGDYDRAIADFNQALIRDPRDDRSLLNRGLAYLKKGDA